MIGLPGRQRVNRLLEDLVYGFGSLIDWALEHPRAASAWVFGLAVLTVLIFGYADELVIAAGR